MLRNVVELLEADHRKVESLFRQLEDSSPKRAERVFNEIEAELEIHTSAEETAIYPRWEKAEELQDGAMDGYREHDEIREWLLKVRKAGFDEDESFREPVRQLEQAVRYHFREEEEKLFPKMQKTFPKEILIQMASEVESTKRKLAKVG